MPSDSHVPSPFDARSCDLQVLARFEIPSGRNCKSMIVVATARCCLRPLRTREPPTNHCPSCLLRRLLSACSMCSPRLQYYVFQQLGCSLGMWPARFRGDLPPLRMLPSLLPSASTAPAQADGGVAVGKAAACVLPY